MKLVNLLREALINEIEKKPNPCDSLGEGNKFCKGLQNILSTGTGGKGAELLKKKSFDMFKQLRDGDYISMGDKIVLQPGNKQFEDRISDMVLLTKILKKHNSCSAIVKAVEQDMKKLATKGLTMLVDDEQKYSLFNRINTHSTNQSYIITLLALEENKKKDFKFYKIDTFDNRQIIEEVTELLNDPSTMSRLDTLISNLINNPDTQQQILDAFNYSRNVGYAVEDAGYNALKSIGYEVYPFSDDFGFIDYFGIDMVAVDDKGAHPVQVSSKMKSNPKIFDWEAPDCKVFALAKSGDKFLKYSPLA